MPDSQNVQIKPWSTKGLLSLGVVGTYAGMWAYAIYVVLNGLTTTISEGSIAVVDPIQFLTQFAGATGVMGVIVVIIIQNFFRKTEAQ